MRYVCFLYDTQEDGENNTRKNNQADTNEKFMLFFVYDTDVPNFSDQRPFKRLLWRKVICSYNSFEQAGTSFYHVPIHTYSK